MTELIKQRLLGMLIVVIAGVVFIPDLLDGKKDTTKADFKKIPAKPSFEMQKDVADFPTDIVEETIAKAEQVRDEVALDAEPTIKPANSESTASPEASDADESLDDGQLASLSSSKPTPIVETPTTTTDEVTKTASMQPNEDVEASRNENAQMQQPLWILQLGSFKHKENVISLREKLRAVGIETYTKPVQTKAGILSKVYVGPEQDKAVLEQTQIKIKELNGLVGKITRFERRN